LNLADVIREAVSHVDYDARRCGIHISCSLTKSVEVVGSDVQLQQVIVNLLRNACDSVIEVTTPQVRVRLSVDGKNATVVVEDNGSGIAEDQRSKLFDAFVTSKPNGMGMGLAISRSIIEAHNGHLSVDSEFPIGARFCISLPAANLN
jgi:signal transduction histidine kinase